MQIYAALGVAALYERKEWAARDKKGCQFSNTTWPIQP